jgi:hypothetical protein
MVQAGWLAVPMGWNAGPAVVAVVVVMGRLVLAAPALFAATALLAASVFPAVPGLLATPDDGGAMVRAAGGRMVVRPKTASWTPIPEGKME